MMLTPPRSEERSWALDPQRMEGGAVGSFEEGRRGRRIRRGGGEGPSMLDPPRRGGAVVGSASPTTKSAKVSNDDDSIYKKTKRNALISKFM